MSKVKIELVSIGHLPLEFNSKNMSGFSSSLFEVVGGVDNLALRCNSDGESWEFSDSLLKDQMPMQISDAADFRIAIVNVPLEDDWYSRRLDDKQIVITFHEIKEILQFSNIPLENVVYRLLNAYALSYKRARNKLPTSDSMIDFTHDETRGCLFDMNGLKSDLVASCHRPIICDECKERLRRDKISDNEIKAVEKDIKKIQKDLYYRILDQVRLHPIWALVLSSFFAFILGVSGSIVGSYIFEYMKKM